MSLIVIRKLAASLPCYRIRSNFWLLFRYRTFFFFFVLGLQDVVPNQSYED